MRDERNLCVSCVEGILLSALAEREVQVPYFL